MKTLHCDEGRHGSTERRTVARDGWLAMSRGTCAGTVFSIMTGEETDCECRCHLDLSAALAEAVESTQRTLSELEAILR